MINSYSNLQCLASFAMCCRHFDPCLGWNFQPPDNRRHNIGSPLLQLHSTPQVRTGPELPLASQVFLQISWSPPLPLEELQLLSPNRDTQRNMQFFKAKNWNLSSILCTYLFTDCDMVVVHDWEPPFEAHSWPERPGRFPNKRKLHLLRDDSGFGESRSRLVVEEVSQIRLAPHLFGLKDKGIWILPRFF